VRVQSEQRMQLANLYLALGGGIDTTSNVADSGGAPASAVAPQ